MKTNNIKMLIALHKPYRVPDDPMYLPLQVGAEGKDLRLGFACDNEGENISAKNANYCELTGIYWAWKNLQADYIGLSHYRRYFVLKKKGGDKFASVLTGDQAEELLKKADAILPVKRNYYIETNESQYLHAHHAEPWLAMMRIIREDYAEYVPALEKMRKARKGHRFNMFVMKQEHFNAYCAWLFDILGKVEEQVDISGYDPVEARVFGYLSERLLDVWVDTNKINYTEVPVAFMEKQNWWKKGTAFLRRKFKGK